MNADSLGAYLSRCRTRSGLSVEAVSAGSRIVPRFVHALEADRHADLPAPIYVRGFIRAYCDEVGADVERALRLYDVQSVPDPPLTVRPAAPAAIALPAVSPWRRIVAGSLVVAALGAVAVLLLVQRKPDAVASRGGPVGALVSDTAAPAVAAVPVAPTPPAPPETSGPQVTAASPAPTAIPAAAPVPTAPDPAAPRVTGTTPAPPASPAAPATATPPAPVERVLLMRAVDTTWVRVTPDGGPPTEETLWPGAVRRWKSAGTFRITVGNAGGVLLELDGHALPALGERGQVVHRTIPDERRP